MNGYRKIFFSVFFLFISYHVYADLLIFAGSAVKPPLDEIAKKYSIQCDCKINVSYGGSGFVLSQMELSERGDIYFPASPDFMEKAKKKKIVLPETEKKIAYLIPVINVQKGNPKGIKTLADLEKPGIRIAVGNPQSVCIGLYAVEIMEYNGMLDRIWNKIAVSVESCEKVAAVLAIGTVDAIVGWNVFEKWHSERIGTVWLNPSEIPRIAYIPVVVSKFSKNRDLALKFIEFLGSEYSLEIFRNNGYITSEIEARKYAPSAKLGGEYNLPEKLMPGR